MSRNTKTVLKMFGYLHCDDFAAYLTEMAAKGWHFKAWKAGLAFEKGDPQDVTYAVEVFIDGSEYDTRPGVHTREFAEYCEAAGWQLVDAKRKFVIFRRIREDAVPILTASERLENIAREERKEILQKMALSYSWSVLQLLNFTGAQFVNRIFSNELLLISAIWFSLAICATARFLHFLLWKWKCGKAIESGEVLCFGSGKNLFAFSNGWYSWLSGGAALAYLTWTVLTKQYGVLIFALIFAGVLILMAYLIARFRPDSGTNQMIQIVVSVVMVIAVMAASVVIVFSDDNKPEIPNELPLYFEDIGGEAGEIKDTFYDSSENVFGSGIRCRIEYEEEYVFYDVYTSDHAWIINRIWNDRMEQKYNQEGENVADLFGAVKAIRNGNGDYLVKYDNQVMRLSFAEDTVLTQENIAVILAALRESR